MIIDRINRTHYLSTASFQQIHSEQSIYRFYLLRWRAIAANLANMPWRVCLALRYLACEILVAVGFFNRDTELV